MDGHQQAAAAASILVLGATGRVGRHVVGDLVRRLSNESAIVYAATRDPAAAPAQSLLQLTAPGGRVRVELLPLDLADASEEELEAACRGKLFIFLAMPQPFTAPQMLACQQRLARALAQTKPRCLVKLSSFGIDDKSSKFVMTQGPLGEAHREGEAALCAAGIPWLVSLRPSSFFANFDAYDLPGLVAGGRCIRSPLGPDARVNWVACEDIGAAGAAVLLRALQRFQSSVEAADGEQQPSFEAIDVLGPQANNLSGPGLAALVTHALQSQPQTQRETPATTATATCEYEEMPVPADDAYGGLWRFLRAGGFDAWMDDGAPLWGEWVGRAPRRMGAHVSDAVALSLGGDGDK